jgi:hypothetical protein
MIIRANSNPRIKLLIIGVDILLIVLSFLMVGITMKIDVQDMSFQSAWDKIMLGIFYLWISTMSILIITILTLIGTILFKILKRNEIFQGFAISLIINLIIIVIGYYLYY